MDRIEWRSARASRIAAVADVLSDSGLETHFVILMRSIGVVVVQQVWVDGHPLDALIGDRLVVQLDGFAHHSSTQDRRRDIEADARLRLRGYTVRSDESRRMPTAPPASVSAEERCSLVVAAAGNRVQLAQCLCERDADDVGALHRDHLAPCLLDDRVGRVESEAGREHTVERGR